MADDPLNKLPEEYRSYVAILVEKARSDGYFQAKLEHSATWFGRPTVTQDAPDGFNPEGPVGLAVARRRLKAHKRSGKAKARQAEKYVREFFESDRVENATAKDALLAVVDKHKVPLDFTEVGRALRGLAKQGILTKTGEKTWSLTAALVGDATK